MGGAASIFRRKRSKNAEGDMEKNGVSNKTVKAPAADKATPGDEGPLTFEGVDSVLSRLAQAHPTQTPDRWDLIAQNLNRIMKKKKIPAQPLKLLIAKEGLCIPQCWVSEIAKTAQKRKDKLLSAERGGQKLKGLFGKSLFGKKKGAVKRGGSSGEGDAHDIEGESDTDQESDAEGDVPAVGDIAAVESVDSSYVYQPLSKYEVFSYMRRVHEHLGAGLLDAEEATESIREAQDIVSMLYEQLPAGTVKAMSQENRLKAGLRQDSLVYGELEVSYFMKVMVKLKRIHGHMMTPGGSFWDVGAGVGKLVIAAAMMHNFESCYGVEVLEDLRFASRAVLDRWRKEEVQKLKAAKASIRVDFIFADAMKQQGWVKEATLLLVHTNLSATNLRELRTRAGGMQVGSICLSVSAPAVHDDKWGLLATEHVETSWGKTELYIHEKLVA